MENSVNVFLYLLCFSLIRVAKFQALSCSGAKPSQKFQINDGTCKNYYMCVDNGVTLEPVRLSCADGFIFDSDKRECSSSATCTQIPTRPCFRYSRSWVPDANCKQYYLCYWNGTQYVASTKNYSCPNTLVFNPLLEKCVLPNTFTCPGLNG